ncbi:MAG: fumarylacetoacetate hydrolase family protein [Anaerolineae bacterium]|nr:fumarylacetoacetate hydrolase family protein [Anaerolineae bacterium]MDQ7035527.1 fumarylacetoacetate hydrolase family protein [Anaerolineae bacterium]
MRFLTYYAEDTIKLGLVSEEGVIETGITPHEFYRAGNAGLDAMRVLLDKPSQTISEDSLKLAPVVPHPSKIICVGLNYRKHAAESGMAEPSSPVLFSKFNNAIAAHNEGIPFSSEYKQVDYEAELVVVMGKEAKNVSEADALDYVLGYCNGDDLSERALQLQMPGGQWLLGKTPDKFMPIGPYLVTADEVGDPQDMSIKGWLNGELRQDSHTSDMIFTVAEAIAFASRFMTLYSGDIISTGTPEGVILGMAEKQWMQVGDEYTVEIGNLGRLTNKLVAG